MYRKERQWHLYFTKKKDYISACGVCVCLAVIEWIYYQWNNLNIQQVDPNDYGFYGQELELGPLRLIAHHG